jgi:molybdopterin-guanine dinucleotide biosynthesis protein A
VATTFKSPFDQFPEPLVTIWEPRSYPILLQFMGQGYTCPRKVLLNSPIELLVAENTEALENVNKPDELNKALGKIKK